MKERQIRIYLILLLIMCMILSSCKKIDLSKWNIFKQEIKASYLDINAIKIIVFNIPTLLIEITGKNIDNEEKEEIMKKLVDFVLSDAGFKEMESYFVEHHRMEAKEFHNIQINFIDTDYDKSKDRIRYSSSRDKELLDGDHRGYEVWTREDLETGTSEIIDVLVTNRKKVIF